MSEANSQNYPNATPGQPQQPHHPQVIRVSGPLSPASDGANALRPHPAIIRMAGPRMPDAPSADTSTAPQSAASPSQDFEAAQAERELDRSTRIVNILSSTPNKVLLPDTTILVHRTTPEVAQTIVQAGFRADGGLVGTVSALATNASGRDLQRIRQDNAAELASLHHGGHIAVLMQFPAEMPADVRLRYDQMDDSEKRGIAQFNAYLELRLDSNDGEQHFTVPDRYVVGAVDQLSGQYYARDQYLAVSSDAQQ